MRSNFKTLIGDKKINLRNINYEVPSWMINTNKEFIKRNHDFLSPKIPNISPKPSNWKIQQPSSDENILIIRDPKNQEIEKLIETININKMDSESQEINKMFTNFAAKKNYIPSKGNLSNMSSYGINNFSIKKENTSKSNSLHSDLSINDSFVSASGLRSLIGKKRQPDDMMASLEPGSPNASNNMNYFMPHNRNLMNYGDTSAGNAVNKNNTQMDNLAQILRELEHKKSLHPNELPQPCILIKSEDDNLGANSNSENLQFNNISSNKHNKCFPSYQNINCYDNMLETLTDDEKKQKTNMSHADNQQKNIASNSQVNMNSSIPIKQAEEFYSKKISYMNREEIKEMNNIVGDGRNLRKIYKEEKMKLEAISSNQIKREIEEKQTNQNPKINQSGAVTSSSNKNLENLLISRKSKVFFKLFYKSKELVADLSILFKSVEKSVMNIDYFLTLEEFLSLKMTNADYQLCGKLEISIPNYSDEDTKIFFEKMGENRVALVDNLEGFYLIIFSKNKQVIHTLDFILSSAENIKEREDLIVILNIKNDFILEKIRSIIKDMFDNKSRTVLFNSEIQCLSKENNKENIYPHLEEKSNGEQRLKELMKEIEDLRQYKHKSKELTEELIKKKEYEAKFKFKLLYDRLLESKVEKLLSLEKENEELKSDKSILSNNCEEGLKRTDLLKNEIIKYQNDFYNLREKFEVVELEKENALKNEKLLMTSLSDAIRDLKQTKQHLAEAESKLIEAEKKLVNSHDSSLIKIDDFLIEEVPLQAATGADPNEKISELQTKIESYLCIICCTNSRDCLFLECNHLCLCFECLKNRINGNNVKTNKKKKQKPEENKLTGKIQCPICKKDNFNFQKILIA